jgi:hypothetical protein
MSNYNLKLYAFSDAATNVSNIFAQTFSGVQWNWYATPTVTLNNAAVPQTVGVSDTDASPNTFGDHWPGTMQQFLSAPLTINGTTYPAGTLIEDEYEITLTDGLGGQFRLVVVAVVDSFNVESMVGFTFEGPPPLQGTQLTYVPGSAADDQSMVPCFCSGTMIDTSTGPLPVQDLTIGDLVVTLDAGAQPLRWIARRDLSAEALHRMPQLRPIQIEAGALGSGMPAATLCVSPQHRILLRSAIARQISGASEVLVAAKHLCDLPGIAVVSPQTAVSYVHFLLDRHQIVTANGAATETLYIGPQMLRSVPPAALREIRQLFPALLAGAQPPSARPLLAGCLGRRIARRHAKTAKPLVTPLPELA